MHPVRVDDPDRDKHNQRNYRIDYSPIPPIGSIDVVKQLVAFTDLPLAHCLKLFVDPICLISLPVQVLFCCSRQVFCIVTLVYGALKPLVLSLELKFICISFNGPIVSIVDHLSVMLLLELPHLVFYFV